MGCARSSHLGVSLSQPRLGSCSSISSSRTLPCLTLTQHEKRLIQASWRHLETNMTTIGTQVFLRIFDQNPKVKELFPFRDEWGDKLVSHPTFVTHAHRFMTVVKQAVERLDSIEQSFCPVLLQLGARHARNSTFSVEHFRVFIQSMLFIWGAHLREAWTPEMREAWRGLLHYIMRRLQDGFDASVGVWTSPHPRPPPIHIDLIKGQFRHQGNNHI